MSNRIKHKEEVEHKKVKKEEAPKPELKDIIPYPKIPGLDRRSLRGVDITLTEPGQKVSRYTYKSRHITVDFGVDGKVTLSILTEPYKKGRDYYTEREIRKNGIMVYETYEGERKPVPKRLEEKAWKRIEQQMKTIRRGGEEVKVLPLSAFK